MRFRDATLKDVAVIAGLQNAAAGALTARFGEGRAGSFYARYGFVERGRVVYRGNHLIYFELRIK